MSAKEIAPMKIATTIHLSKYLHDSRRKMRAQKAIKQIVATGQKIMGTETVKIDQELNSRVWYRGRNNAPVRVRVIYERKADTEETGKFITVASYQNVPTFNGLLTEKIVDQ